MRPKAEMIDQFVASGYGINGNAFFTSLTTVSKRSGAYDNWVWLSRKDFFMFIPLLPPAQQITTTHPW
jgi:hypothetical protein